MTVSSSQKLSEMWH